jgi:aspartyl protease family protein
MLRAMALIVALGLPALALAQSVSLAGMLGGRALLMVDGNPPKSVAAGDAYKGVKVISTQGDEAVLEVGGKRLTLRVGESPASVGTAEVAPGASSRVVLSVGSGGHFLAQGYINGRPIRMVVDTGATVIALSVADAQQVGLKYEGAQQVPMSTANGTTPAWRVKLQSVRLGDVTVYEVDAVVIPSNMPAVLLGNSFLSRFQMTRTNDQMVLDKRF